MKQKIIIEIDANYGSEFQCNFAFKSLVAILRAWRSHVLRTHKQNKIVCVLNGNYVKDIPT